ncbi:MAG: HesA/MoeB/ThiF family protein, partial [Fimbriimonadaceae bacterium]|nr:HesA/MoeB/ThiF family protein [Chitinophagales bacterium]
QVLYTPAEVGSKKVAVAGKKLRQQNPGISLIPHDVKITSENVMDIIMPYDIVLDCTDNFDTKYLLNDACVLTGKPLVYGAIYQYEGQVSIWNMSNSDNTRTPNYRDLFPNVNPAQVPDCADGGVMPTLAGIIGCMQANEVIKYLTKTGELLAGKILMFDAQTMQSRIIKVGSVTKTNITALPETLAEPVISAKDLKRAINKDVYELVDVRTLEEHNLFNIGGRNFPVNELEKNMLHLHNGKPIVMYCSSGKRSGEAVKLLNNKFPGINIFSLEGGLKAWQEADQG